MNLCKFGFVILLCFTFQTDANHCTIYGCKQNSPSDILEENLTLTTKLPRCIMARNYDGLSFSVVLENKVYQSCSWIFSENFLDSNGSCVDYDKKNRDNSTPFGQENIFTNFAPCTNRSSSHQGVREITCVKNNEKNYSSIVFKSIDNDYFVSVQCNDIYTKGFHVKVQPCNVTFGQQGNQVYVNSNSSDYNAAGSFRCENNGILFYTSGTLVQDTSTRCLQTAEWKGQNDLQCWKAPSVKLQGNYNRVNKNKLVLQCNYTDGFPAANGSKFYVNNTVIAILSKGETFNFTVNRTFNKVPVSCQAQTPFTQLYSKTGRSNDHFLNVLFAPYPLQGKCVQNSNSDKICEFKFFSNPNATVVSLFLEGINITHSSDFTLTVTNHLHIFSLNIIQNLENSFGTYNLTVRTLFQPHLYHMLFTISSNSEQVSSTHATATTSEKTDDIFFSIGISVGGSLAVLVLVIVITFVIMKRKRQKEKVISDNTKQSCENEVVMNELYVSADILQNERTKPSTDKPQQTGHVKNNKVVYGVVNKPKKKPQTLDESSEREEKINELYASTDMLDNKGSKLTTKETQKAGNNIDTEVAYGVVNKPKKKSQNTDNKTINEKPESSTKPGTEKKKKAQKKTVNKKKSNNLEKTKPSTEESQQTANKKDNEVAYGVVNKPKKNPKASAESSEKEEKINELYVSADMLENKDNEKHENFTKPYTEKKKKVQNQVAVKKKAKKPEGSKPSPFEPQQAANIKDNEVAYGVVNKPKKKPKTPADKENSADGVGRNKKDLYQSVDFTKKKKNVG